mmetsp:Transcript_48694/g.135762  ORF Transcript_48694/g.135762 Transcript_48694/m.135762 type:complete len:309 (-) Transcript_48694:182-1108(-)
MPLEPLVLLAPERLQLLLLLLALEAQRLRLLLPGRLVLRGRAGSGCLLRLLRLAGLHGLAEVVDGPLRPHVLDDAPRHLLQLRIVGIQQQRLCTELSCDGAGEPLSRRRPRRVLLAPPLDPLPGEALGGHDAAPALEPRGAALLRARQDHDGVLHRRRAQQDRGGLLLCGLRRGIALRLLLLHGRRLHGRRRWRLVAEEGQQVIGLLRVARQHVPAERRRLGLEALLHALRCERRRQKKGARKLWVRGALLDLVHRLRELGAQRGRCPALLLHQLVEVDGGHAVLLRQPLRQLVRTGAWRPSDADAER